MTEIGTRSRIAQPAGAGGLSTARRVASHAGKQADGKKRRRRLRRWFAARRRRFQWRERSEPWPVFVAEMLLRRTRAEQVAAHLPRVLSSYPNPGVMAAASMSEVRAALRSLGLVWRADTLKEAAEIIDREHAGCVPLDESALLSLPGVGPYVAYSLLARFTKQRVVLTDTNTVRVAVRVNGLSLRGDVRRRIRTQEALRGLLGGTATAADWWAVLDLAASTCTPRNPRCSRCPIVDHCLTGAGLVSNGAAVEEEVR
jgi:A/G-specific adenine glycosylase